MWAEKIGAVTPTTPKSDPSMDFDWWWDGPVAVSPKWIGGCWVDYPMPTEPQTVECYMIGADHESEADGVPNSEAPYRAVIDQVLQRQKEAVRRVGVMITALEIALRVYKQWAVEWIVSQEVEVFARRAQERVDREASNDRMRIYRAWRETANPAIVRINDIRRNIHFRERHHGEPRPMFLPHTPPNEPQWTSDFGSTL